MSNNPAMQQLTRVFGKVNSKLTLLANIKDSDGSLVTSGTINWSLTQDFSPYTVLVNSLTSDVTIHDPAKGTESNPDSRWSKANHNNEGFNVEITIAANLFASTGRYRMEIVRNDIKTLFEINIGS